MLLHAHPVNAAREEAGLPTVASVWWWGGGSWVEFGPPAVDAVAGGPSWVGAACAAAGIGFEPLPAGPAPAMPAGTRRTLLILEDAWEEAAMSPDPFVQWDQTWFGPLRTALDAGQLDQAALILPWGDGTLRVELEPPRRSRWRRWLHLGRPAAAPALAETLKAFLR